MPELQARFVNSGAMVAVITCPTAGLTGNLREGRRFA
jgi:hypothetical protein